jgi:hypothetical protein
MKTASLLCVAVLLLTQVNVSKQQVPSVPGVPDGIGLPTNILPDALPKLANDLIYTILKLVGQVLPKIPLLQLTPNLNLPITLKLGLADLKLTASVFDNATISIAPNNLLIFNALNVKLNLSLTIKNPLTGQEAAAIATVLAANVTAVVQLVVDPVTGTASLNVTACVVIIGSVNVKVSGAILPLGITLAPVTDAIAKALNQTVRVLICANIRLLAGSNGLMLCTGLTGSIQNNDLPSTDFAIPLINIADGVIQVLYTTLSKGSIPSGPNFCNNSDSSDPAAAIGKLIGGLGQILSTVLSTVGNILSAVGDVLGGVGGDGGLLGGLTGLIPARRRRDLPILGLLPIDQLKDLGTIITKVTDLLTAILQAVVKLLQDLLKSLTGLPKIIEDVKLPASCTGDVAAKSLEVVFNLTIANPETDIIFSDDGKTITVIASGLTGITAIGNNGERSPVLVFSTTYTFTLTSGLNGSIAVASITNVDPTVFNPSSSSTGGPNLLGCLGDLIKLVVDLLLKIVKAVLDALKVALPQLTGLVNTVTKTLGLDTFGVSNLLPL